jgi:hypothetical protein
MWDLTIPGNGDHDFYVIAGIPGQPGNSHHTYHVVAGGTPILVHNASCGLPGWDNLADGKQVGKVKVVNNATDLRNVFNQWTQGATRLPARGPKIPDVYQLSDGTVVQWRTSSASGGERIDIFSGTDQFKVHIDGSN